DGLIARFGDIVIYIADPSASADRLIAAVKSQADSSGPRRKLARRLAALAFGEQTIALSPFGVVAATDEGLHVLLYGRVTAKIETAEGIRELSGARALTWVDETVPDSAQRIVVADEGQQSLPSGANTDLHAGVVPGGGFDLHRAPAKKVEPPAAEAAAPKAPAAEAAAPKAPSQEREHAQAVARDEPAIPEGATDEFPRARATALAASDVGSLASDDG